PDPALGASLLVFASNEVGHCRLEVALPAGNWKPLRGDGPNRGWRYLDPAGSAGGVRKIVIKPRRGGGSITIKSNGIHFPCGLEAAAERLPIAVALRIDTKRYCASFASGTVTANGVGKFKAENAAAPAACPDDDLTVADINILHGIFCGTTTAQCR